MAKGGTIRGAGLIVVGLAFGGLMISPAGAHIGKGLPHLRRHLDNFFLMEAEGDAAYINVGEAASNADRLDNLDSTAFLPVAGKAADADTLDNIDSAAFLQTGSALDGVFNCPGVGFSPENSGSATNTDGEGLRSLVSNQTLRCAVHLPNGATVTGVAFTVFGGAGDVTDCTLTRTDLTVPVGAEDFVTTAVSTSGADAETTLTPTLVAGNTVIANSSFAYSLECTVAGGGASGGGIFGAAVSYTVPASVG
ncbi:MAG: hypothetical protein ACRDHO_12750 [Actinomycetota bacterium]|jgi:hypothetical protein